MASDRAQPLSAPTALFVIQVTQELKGTYDDSLLVDNLRYRGARIHDHREANDGEQ